MKNKKGDIPVTVLVIGVFAICGFALLSFLKSESDIQNSFVGVNEVEKMNSYIEKYNFYRNVEGLDEDTAKERLDLNMSKQEKGALYFERIDTSGFLFWKQEKVTLSIKYILP